MVICRERGKSGEESKYIFKNISFAPFFLKKTKLNRKDLRGKKEISKAEKKQRSVKPKCLSSPWENYTKN